MMGVMCLLYAHESAFCLCVVKDKGSIIIYLKRFVFCWLLKANKCGKAYCIVCACYRAVDVKGVFVLKGKFVKAGLLVLCYHRGLGCVSYGTRTRVTCVKGGCPRPLDEGDVCCYVVKLLSSWRFSRSICILSLISSIFA
jgi:hypothetical protein